MDIRTRFINQYDESTPGTPTFIKLSSDELDQLQRQTFESGDTVNLPIFTPVVRQQLAKNRPGDVPEILRACAGLMTKQPGLAQAIGATPQLCLDVAEQGLSLRGLLLASSDLAQAASDGALLCSHLLADSCDNALLTAKAAETDQDISPQDRADARTAFGTALRLQQEVAQRQADAASRAQSADKPVVDEVQNSQQDSMVAQQLENFLAEARKKAAAEQQPSLLT